MPDTESDAPVTKRDYMLDGSPEAVAIVREARRLPPLTAEGRPCSCGISADGSETTHGRGPVGVGSEVIAHRAYPDECHVLPPGGGEPS
jgi:hypothetical protein